jgi:methionine-S-sulfoxide reductase
VFGLFQTAPQTQAPHAVLGTPIEAAPEPGQHEAVFGCGCFWGAEKGFWRLPGVVTTAVGYAGGTIHQPSYDQVCSGRTGHSEVVRVVWDTALVDFSDLLKLFWECHDPTQGDRQGNDRGSQYRSVIYLDDPGLMVLAQASRQAGARVLLLGMQMPPNYGARYSADFAALYAQVARQSQSALVPFFLQGVADRSDPTELFQNDRIHPNEQAQPRMLDNVWPELRKLIK